MRIRKSVDELEPYVPGEQPRDKSVIKLNTNENPYLPSPLVKKALESFDPEYLRKYPDPVFTDLRARIAEIHGTVPARVFIGNGSDEVLSLACRAFVENDEAIGSFDPSYSLYKTLAAIRDVSFVPSPLGPGFAWSEPVERGADGKDVALFLLTNPNAPTSVQYPKEKIAGFASRFRGVVLVDEAYGDFAPYSCADLAAAPDNRNLIVMRTLSKSFSLAGLRFGYCIGPEDLVEALYKVKDSYNVDAVAQAVALAALHDLKWMRGNAAKICRTRDEFAASLRSRGWDVPESASNFVFARPPAKPGVDAHERARTIFERLKGRHIYVRYFRGPETGDRLRVTIGTSSDMDALTRALDEIEGEIAG